MNSPLTIASSLGTLLLTACAGQLYQQPTHYHTPPPATRETPAERASSLLDRSLRGHQRLYLGRCGFSDDLRFAQIWWDEMAWFATVSDSDPSTKDTFMQHFFDAARGAATAVAGQPIQPYFHLVNSQETVMARGVIVAGNRLPNYVPVEHWKHW